MPLVQPPENQPTPVQNGNPNLPLNLDEQIPTQHIGFAQELQQLAASLI
jgi:hypothetical protein